MFATVKRLVKAATLAYIEHDGLSRGAAIAFYTVTSLAPVLLIVIAIAGLAVGRDVAQHAITDQMRALMGNETADVLQAVVENASRQLSGILAATIGAALFVFTASGVFGEMQTALNVIWQAKPTGSLITRIFRGRAASIGLVAALGFLLMVSLAVSAGLTAFANHLNATLPFGGTVLSVINAIISWLLISALFAAVFKVLPDVDIEWRDVAIGGLGTGFLFTAGKSLIGWYIGSSAMATTYGAAGALIVLLLWVYYSAQIFLIGAEFTKAHADLRRQVRTQPAAA
jgi:membrane protein